MPFHFDEATVKRGLNFTLTTSLGDLNLLGKMTDGGTYEQVIEHTISLNVFGREIKVLDLPGVARRIVALGGDQTRRNADQ